MFRYSEKTGSQPPGTVPPLAFEPGTRWQYGAGIDWAGRVVEKISGLDLEQYFQRNILQPLAMHDTSSSSRHLNSTAWSAATSARAMARSKKIRARSRPPPKSYGGGGG